MAERIPISTAKKVVFRAFLASDGKTPATGKTIAITISKNGGAFGNPNAGATNATEISSGFYKFDLDTTDTGTGGPLAWRGAEAAINDAGDAYEVVTGSDTQVYAIVNSGTHGNAALKSLIDAVDDFLDTEIAAILAAVDTEVGAIKTKTDSLTFTVAGKVDANATHINETELTGDGGATPWGPA